MNTSWIMSDIIDLNYSAAEGFAEIEFYDHDEDKTVQIIFKDVLMFKISNAPGEMETTLVADVSISLIEGSVVSTELRGKGYGWTEVPEYPAQAYKLRAEGGTVLDIIASEISIKEKQN